MTRNAQHTPMAILDVALRRDRDAAATLWMVRRRSRMGSVGGSKVIAVITPPPPMR